MSVVRARCAHCGRKFCEIESCDPRKCKRKRHARNLCRADYYTLRNAGKLGMYPNGRQHAPGETYNAYLDLAEQGFSCAYIARHLGIKPDSLKRAIQRARKKAAAA